MNKKTVRSASSSDQTTGWSGQAPLPSAEGAGLNASAPTAWGASGGNGIGGAGGIQRTDDLNVQGCESLISPRQVKQDLPMSCQANRTVVESRQTIKNILTGSDHRLLAVLGPCSIHEEKSALEYAHRLADLSRQVRDRMFIVMRVYFEKPRTTIGWKGFINDPHLDGSFDMEQGIRRARQLLMTINEMGLPAGTEMLDPITPQYIADLIGWVAIGARTIESQTHRQMASGLSMPVGYKNGTGGDLQLALDAMQSAYSEHRFLGIDEDGRTAVVRTRGNRFGHLILRGGKSGPNYQPESVAKAAALMVKSKLPPAIMVDCSHANSNKQFRNQEVVWRDVIEQRLNARPGVIVPMGLLVESHLEEGNQSFPQPIEKLRYGVSITDECLGWSKTEELIRWAYQELSKPTASV